MKRGFVVFTFLVFCVNGLLISGVKVGEEIRIRAKTVVNQNYDKTLKDYNNYFEQRNRFFIEGILPEGISLKIKLQSEGYWGVSSSNSSIIADDRLNLWVENAYIKFTQIKGFPIDLTIGRQPISYKDGLIINDDARGFNAINIGVFLPYKIISNFYVIKARENSGDTPGNFRDNNGYLLTLKRKWKKKTFIFDLLLYSLLERNYFPDEKEKKNFVGLCLSNKLIKGIEYGLEITKGWGTIENNNYNSFAYIIQSSLKAESAYGMGKLHLAYAKGSGDKLDTSKKEDFYSSYMHIDEEKWGEYYLTHRNNPDYSVINQEDNTLTDLTIFKVGIEINPKFKINTEIDYFIYSSPGKNVILGDEFDICVKYDYSTNALLRLVYGIFMPDKGIKEKGDNATKIMAEVVVKF